MTIPGTAAPQCGNSSEVTETDRSGEQPTREWFSRGVIYSTSTLNSLQQHVTKHPAGGQSCHD